MKMRYNQIMDKIEVTDEMRNRILNHIQNVDLEDSPKVQHFPAYKRYLSIAACFAVLLIGALSLPNWLNQSQQTPPVEQGVPDIRTFSSARELSETVGFGITDISNLPFDVVSSAYTSYWKELAEIVYNGDTQTAVFRKSIGRDDNSGDYGTYDAVTEITVGTTSVTLKGHAEKYNLAIWSDGKFSYSLRLSSGISAAKWRGIISEIG